MFVLRGGRSPNVGSGVQSFRQPSVGNVIFDRHFCAVRNGAEKNFCGLIQVDDPPF